MLVRTSPSVSQMCYSISGWWILHRCALGWCQLKFTLKCAVILKKTCIRHWTMDLTWLGLQKCIFFCCRKISGSWQISLGIYHHIAQPYHAHCANIRLCQCWNSNLFFFPSLGCLVGNWATQGFCFWSCQRSGDPLMSGQYISLVLLRN